MNKQRKQIRLKNYDYSQSGLYFVTICTENRENVFGDIVGATRGSPTTIGRDRPVSMILNQYGKIVTNVWESLPNHHPVELDAFQIMPNHVHFVLRIISGGSRPNDSGGSQTGRSRPTPTLGLIIGLFKSECTKQINIVGATRGSPKIHLWQRNYYEHIIRNEQSLEKIRSYIDLNPKMWERDRNNPLNAKKGKTSSNGY